MTPPLIFHPDVKGDIDSAYRWYEDQRTGVGERFLAALDDVFKRVEQMPEAHQIVYQGVRRALTRRFPYVVYFRLLTDCIEVLAVQHGRRDSSHWKTRV